MFFKLTLQKIVKVSPADLGNCLNRRLLIFLRDEVERKPLPLATVHATGASNNGQANMKSSAIIVAVLDIHGAENIVGKVLDDGSVSFLLTYDALVLKLHRGEVLDVTVNRVSQEGFWGSVYGVGNIFVSSEQMSEMSSDMSYMMHSVRLGDQPNAEWVYEQDSGSWLSADGTRSIKEQGIVRVRVLAETPQSNNGIALGTMAGRYLGPV